MTQVSADDPDFISGRHLRFFLTGNTSLEVEVANPTATQDGSTWLGDKSWADILAMSALPGFEGFRDRFVQDLDSWRDVIRSQNPNQTIAERYALTVDEGEEKSQATTICSGNMSRFQRLCILRCLRPDKVVDGVRLFISDAIGDQYIDPPTFDLASSYDESNCSTPLIFVLSTGADPTADLLKLAQKRGFSKRLETISLGQGQGAIAAQAVAVAVDKGGWVCLQNCHLAVSWLPELERICETLSPDFTNPEFRLWLTTMPCAEFPVPVLQSSIKITKEPPKGIRASLLGNYMTFEQEWFESGEHPAAFKRLLFSLCFFHASIIERKKFGPLGWNIAYEFSESDLRICIDQLKTFIDTVAVQGIQTKPTLSDLADPDFVLPTEPAATRAEVVSSIPFEAIRYLAGECNYGGRVTDAKDRRTLNTLLLDFYCNDAADDFSKGDGPETFHFAPSGSYPMPAVGRLSEYRTFIRNLPLTDDGPEMYGLHSNANISCALKETSELLETALSLQAQQGSTGGDDSWDDRVMSLARAIAERIPASFRFDTSIVELKYPVMYEESMNTVLTQELMRFNKLLAVIDTTLQELQKAIKGLVLLSDQLENMANSMLDGFVPQLWKAASYPSLKPLGAWVADLVDRLAFYKKWVEEGMPPVYWISGFFFTQSFITGTRQNYARRSQIPIDEISFDFQVLHPDSTGTATTITAGPADGCYVHGLFIEGASWNSNANNLLDMASYGGENGTGAIVESAPKQLFSTMPVIWFWPRPISEIPVPVGRPGGTAQVYTCPVYKTSERKGTLSTTGHSTNFVIDISLPIGTNTTHMHWIKRGVAMLTTAD